MKGLATTKSQKSLLRIRGKAKYVGADVWEDKYYDGNLRTFSFYHFYPLLNGKHCYELRIRIGDSVQRRDRGLK